MNKERGESSSTKEKTALWKNVVEAVGGRPLNGYIEREIDAGRKYFFFVGEPGVGKTAVTQQGSFHIRQLGISVSHVYYDDVLARADQVSTRPRDQWDDLDWNRFSQMYEQEVIRSSQDSEEAALFCEAVVVGTKNRARTAVSNFVKEHPSQSMILYFVPDPRIQEHAATLRTQIQNTPDENVLTIMNSNNVFISDLAVISMEPGEIGKIIKEKYKLMAPKTKIDQIGNEVEVTIDQANNMTLVSAIEELSPDLQEKTRRKLSYLMQLSDEMVSRPKRSDENSALTMLVFNPYKAGPIYLPANYFFSNKSSY